MSRLHGKSTTLYIDERDFSGITNSVEIAVDNGIADVTAFEDVDATFVEGKAGVTLTINGFFSTASPDYDGQMFADLLTAQQLGVYPGIIAGGTHGYEVEGAVEGQPRTAAHGAAIALNVSFKGDNPLVRVIVLGKNTALAASANGIAYNHGAVGATQQAYGVLRAFSVAGGPGTLDVKIQSDDAVGFPSPTDRLTFTQLAAAGVEVKTANGAITDTWWRVVFTVAGGGTWNVLVALGIRPQ